jgi:phosphoglycerate kinase
MNTLKDLKLHGQRVLMRVDFNTPMDGTTIADDERIRAALPSIQYVLDHGAKVVLMSHLGRPKGKDPTCSLRPAAKRLQELLKREVTFIPDCLGQGDGDVILLENLRFYKEEEANDRSFAEKLAKWGTCYVDDAFGTAHRAHASTVGVVEFFKPRVAIGFLMEKELAMLSQLLDQPKRPFYAIIGGAKISSKIGVIKNLLPRVDGLFLGGAMAFTFLKAKGISVGNSLCEDPSLVKGFLDETKIHLPLDWVITDGHSVREITTAKGIPMGWQGMDIGAQTVKAWKLMLQTGATIFWNGPMGVFEKKEFANGTRCIGQIVSEVKGVTIVGGGDSIAALKQMGLADKMTFLSTGGGASLEFLEFGHLVGIDALS